MENDAVTPPMMQIVEALIQSQSGAARPMGAFREKELYAAAELIDAALFGTESPEGPDVEAAMKKQQDDIRALFTELLDAHRKSDEAKALRAEEIRAVFDGMFEAREAALRASTKDMLDQALAAIKAPPQARRK